MTPQMVRLIGAMLRQPNASWYGLELSDATGLKSGTIYPALARLERVGWLESTWEEVDPREEGRPRRRLYRLTGHGAAAARAMLDELAAEIERARVAHDRWGLRPGEQPA